MGGESKFSAFSFFYPQYNLQTSFISEKQKCLNATPRRSRRWGDKPSLRAQRSAFFNFSRNPTHRRRQRFRISPQDYGSSWVKFARNFLLFIAGSPDEPTIVCFSSVSGGLGQADRAARIPVPERLKCPMFCWVSQCDPSSVIPPGVISQVLLIQSDAWLICSIVVHFLHSRAYASAPLTWWLQTQYISSRLLCEVTVHSRRTM